VQAEAEKQLAARKDQITQADAALAKLRADKPAAVTAAEKVLKDANTKLAEAQKLSAPAPEVTAAAQELTKLKAAIDEATTTIASSKVDAERWKVAQVLQTSHNAQAALVDKQGQYEQLVQEIKEAPQAIDKAKADLATAQKTVADAPARAQQKDAALAKAKETFEAAKKTLADAEAAAKDKEESAKTVMDNAPTMGDVTTLTKKMETLNNDATKLREERNTHSPGTPEYLSANEKYQAKKVEITQTQTALTAASKKNMEAPAVKAAQAESDKARGVVDDARRAMKIAAKAATEAEKAVAQVKKDVDAASQLAARLEKDMPQIVKDAEAQKTHAEQAAAAAAKDVEAAKAEAEKRRADYESIKNSGPKAASLTQPATKS
jgi:biopolymer transport protein ExbB/TolQ